jgi:hypothetical protein
MVAYTPNKGYSLPTVAGDLNQWGVFLNQGTSIMDNNMGGQAIVNVAGAADVTATTANAQNLVQSLTGLLTGNISYLLPDVGSFYIINNATTGAFTVTVKTTAGGSSGVIVPQGTQLAVYSRGGNVWILDGSTSGGSANSRTFQGALTIVSGGLTISAGGATVTGNVGITGALTATGIAGGANIGRGALIRKTGTQSITTGTITALTWGAATFDDAAVWSIVTPSRLTVPAGFSRVMIMAGVLWSPNVSGYRQLDIRKNGALFTGSPGSTVQAITTADNMAQNIVSWCAVTPGDYFEAYVYQTSGASLGIGTDSNSWFSIELLR